MIKRTPLHDYFKKEDYLILKLLYGDDWGTWIDTPVLYAAYNDGVEKDYLAKHPDMTGFYRLTEKAITTFGNKG